MIHKYTLNGFRIVLDTHSGAVHLFDEAPYDLLDYLTDCVPAQMPEAAREALTPKYGTQKLEEAYAELLELQEAGQLFSADDYQQFADMMQDAPIKSMCLNIAHDCNLRCAYCFAAQGDFGKGRMLMPFSVAKAAIDFLIRESGTRHNLEVDFFGGEPLMNFDVVKQTVLYARSIEKQHNKNFRFTITTNGLLLDDDKIQFINQEMSNCVLSLDGRKEVNDRLRVCADGKTGSYDLIVPKYQKLVRERSKDKDYYVRGTFTKYNLALFREAAALCGEQPDPPALYERLFQCSLGGAADAGGILPVNYDSGEGVTHFDAGRPLLLRQPDAPLTLANFMRAQIYSAIATLAIGLELLQEEHVQIARFSGHGGLFKTPGVAQRYLAAAVHAPVAVMETAGEGGPYGMALLAAYALRRAAGETLDEFLETRVFRSVPQKTFRPDPADTAGFAAFLKRYRAALEVERAAVLHL